MRGALVGGEHVDVVEGIIPAYAGSTQRARFLRCVAKDHPRVCGEHSGVVMAAVIDLGSSPRMRGAPAAQNVGYRFFGIIPAYAGSTRAYQRKYHGMEDHPRVCGEHHGFSVFEGFLAGSSPRMRGARISETA